MNEAEEEIARKFMIEKNAEWNKGKDVKFNIRVCGYHNFMDGSIKVKCSDCEKEVFYDPLIDVKTTKNIISVCPACALTNYRFLLNEEQIGILEGTYLDNKKKRGENESRGTNGRTKDS